MEDGDNECVKGSRRAQDLFARVVDEAPAGGDVLGVTESYVSVVDKKRAEPEREKDRTAD
jgi:CRISPR/Cas system-associated protein Cas5 (RAMP superfamily)